MMGVTQLPGLSAHMTASAPVWNETFWLALALNWAQRRSPSACSLLVAARRRDPLEGNPMNPNPTARGFTPSTQCGALPPVTGRGLPRDAVFHPGMPPGMWAMTDNSPSFFLADASFVAHSFRMLLFFIIGATLRGSCTSAWARGLSGPTG